MKLVKENIEFKRGQDSKKSLGVGKHRIRTAPFDWPEIPAGNYLALDDLYDYPQHCLIKIRQNGELSPTIRQITYWGETSKDPATNVRPTKLSKFAEDWFEDNDFNILKPYHEHPELFESMDFKRGIKSKDAIGIGVKETNRDLEALAQNFQEHFNKYTFLEHSLYRREPRKGYYTDYYPMYFRMLIDSADGFEFELDRKRKRFRAWFKKNTPYELKSIKKGGVFVNDKARSGYQKSYTFYMDDK